MDSELREYINKLKNYCGDLAKHIERLEKENKELKLEISNVKNILTRNRIV